MGAMGFHPARHITFEGGRKAVYGKLMKKYAKVEVSEQQLEDLVRLNVGQIEEGLVFVDHQKSTGSGRFDVIMADSGKSLVVAELKVVQDDGMLLQGLDYYDYVATQIEAFGRLYKKYSIDPTQKIRLFLIAPSFSQALVNRCKWLDLPISLFTFNCLKFEGEEDVLPIFNEQQVTVAPATVEITQLEDHLAYITDPIVREKVVALLEEIKAWKPGNISADAIQYAISLKANGRVFAYLYARRKYYQIATYDSEDEWTDYPIKTDDDLAKVKPIVKASMERKSKN